MEARENWIGVLVTRAALNPDVDYSYLVLTNVVQGVGEVISEPDAQGIAWVYWGTADGTKYESREVVTELGRLDLQPEWVRHHVRWTDE